MLRKFMYLMLLLSLLSCHAQTPVEDYLGNWEGKLAHDKCLNFELVLEELSGDEVQLTISNQATEIWRRAPFTSDNKIEVVIDDQTRFSLSYAEDSNALIGFARSGILMYHTRLEKSAEGVYKGVWNPIMVDGLQSPTIYLNIDKEDGNLVAYPFFQDQRFTGTWASDFVLRDGGIDFRDFKTGLKFKAHLLHSTIRLEVLMADAIVATVDMVRSTTEWKFGVDSESRQSTARPPQTDDGWPTASMEKFQIRKDLLEGMIASIQAGELENTNSVLIAHQNSLVFESYFSGFHEGIPHDQRSGSKSIASAMIGIAIEDGVLDGVNQKLYDCLPDAVQYTRDAQKEQIRLHDLLTMSAGLDVSGAASEGRYQSSDNWLKTVVEAPMAHEPGTYTDYGSANPFLLGVSLAEKLDQPLEHYMDQRLLNPLGITNYIIQTEETRTMPYFGGGMYLTPRDMLKFGQLYLNVGTWNSKRIISEEWVYASFEKHSRLEDVKDKNEYGYQWWHKTYRVGNTQIESIEARGAGGQYIFVLPALESVVAITSGNFRNGKLLQQPEAILEQYILPALLK
ncbi:MAG: beta-lactamase family protein [Saprospiraceae bacterium]|nr:beta-lactamase family protein [Saprospiraceae bacterium]